MLLHTGKDPGRVRAKLEEWWADADGEGERERERKGGGDDDDNVSCTSQLSRASGVAPVIAGGRGRGDGGGRNGRWPALGRSGGRGGRGGTVVGAVAQRMDKDRVTVELKERAQEPPPPPAVAAAALESTHAFVSWLEAHRAERERDSNSGGFSAFSPVCEAVDASILFDCSRQRPLASQSTLWEASAADKVREAPAGYASRTALVYADRSTSRS